MSHILAQVPVIPIVTIDDADGAVALAEALLAGGLSIIEVALGTAQALTAIERIAKALPEIMVGAGTIIRPADVTAAKRAGAKFLVSPGLTPDLAASGLASGLPYLPGAITPSEVLAAREFKFSLLKFFPAQGAGGIAMLRTYAATFAGVAFCPTGDLTEADAAEYLALPNVPVVGGTWVAPREAIAARDWQGITQRARRAASLRA